MAQAVWTGDLSFGLVNVPVRLYGATSPKSVRFHLYEAGTGRRLRYRRVAEGPVPEPPATRDETWPEQPEPVEAGRDDAAWTDEPDVDAGARDDVAIRDERGPAAPSAPPVADERDRASRRARSEPDEDEVPWNDVVKGVELEPGRVVTFERDELEALAPERSRVFEIERFVDLRAVDPVHFDKSYYVVPRHGPGERAYWLLFRAMERARKAAVGRFVMRTKEHLAVVRPGEHALVLHTMFYADEVRDPKDVGILGVHEPGDDELRVAGAFLDALAGEWEPDRHRDEHRERLLELLRAKAGDARPVPAADEPAPAPSGLADLMAALTASVDAARRAR
ncbi:MAG TPA: Ku protein [Actinomycetota bacterium]|nr:Ku protein [Actinomycetota bacterium]